MDSNWGRCILQRQTGKYFNREKMPRNFASKVFTAKLFPRIARWEFYDPLPAHRSHVVWLLWVAGRTVAVLRVLCAIRTFRSEHLDVYY